jgi:hypothetical protein
MLEMNTQYQRSAAPLATPRRMTPSPFEIVVQIVV